MLQLTTKGKILQATDESQGDFILNFIRSGFRDAEGRAKWFVYEEDAYQVEPWKSGIELLRVDEIEERYKFNIEEKCVDELSPTTIDIATLRPTQPNWTIEEMAEKMENFTKAWKQAMTQPSQIFSPSQDIKTSHNILRQFMNWIDNEDNLTLNTDGTFNRFQSIHHDKPIRYTFDQLYDAYLAMEKGIERDEATYERIMVEPKSKEYQELKEFYQLDEKIVPNLVENRYSVRIEQILNDFGCEVLKKLDATMSTDVSKVMDVKEWISKYFEANQTKENIINTNDAAGGYGGC